MQADSISNTSSTGNAFDTATSPEFHQRLLDAVEAMHILNRDGMSEIRAIARLALKRMQLPDPASAMEDFAFALSAIVNRAEEVRQVVESYAEGVGCCFPDIEQQRRLGGISH